MNLLKTSLLLTVTILFTTVTLASSQTTQPRNSVDEETYRSRIGDNVREDPAANGAVDDVVLLERATEALKTTLFIPENAIPPALLRNAHAIAIFPDLAKVGLIVGGRHGTGIVMVRSRDGVWGTPYKASFSGVSMGFQAGFQSSDVILVFKTRRSTEGLLNGKFTLGADASIAAGPVGRKTEAATDIRLRAEIYSYSRSRGLFAGLSLEGSGLKVEKRMNAPQKTIALQNVLERNSRFRKLGSMR